jgi:hypothetical protein
MNIEDQTISAGVANAGETIRDKLNNTPYNTKASKVPSQ